MDTRKNNSNVICGLLNVQSVGNKTFEIRDTIIDYKLDVFMVTETWLSNYDSAKINEITPATHVFLHVPRPARGSEARRGGGVGIFLTNSFKKIKKMPSVIWETFESIQVSCDINDKKCVFIVVYRPPNTSERLFIDEFRLYLETIDMVSANVVICGDFNIWMDDYDNLPARSFIDLIDTFNMTNKVHMPTSAGGHVLDLILADKDRDLVHEVRIDDVCSVSPVHKLVTFVLPYMKEAEKKKLISFRLKRDFQPETLIRSITGKISLRKDEVCEHNITHGECAHCFMKLFNDISHYEYNDMCPMVEKEIVVRNHAPWFNGEILRAKKEKKKKESYWRRCRSDEARRQFQTARNALNRLIKKRKCIYYRNKLVEVGSNISKLYKVLDSLSGKVKENKLPDGLSNEELAKNFADYFENKIERIVCDFGLNTAPDRPVRVVPVTQLERLHQVSVADIRKIVRRVKLTYCASDPFPMKDIINCTNFDEVLRVMTEMINASINNNVFPESEKMAIVKPILKNNLDTQSLASFRPVSNLTFLSKILENVILDQLMLHLQSVQAIPDNQSAYRQLYSTETALCSVVNSLLVSMDEGKCSVLLLLDLSAAFDTVEHDLLLQDCRNIGIVGDALDYLESYLTGRTYCVQIGKACSDKKCLRRGVPQGSVLGPILFCIYTAELSRLLHRHGVNFKLYADDTQLYMTLDNIDHTESKLSRIMEDVGCWMSTKHLKLNEDKTECLIVGKRSDLRRFDASTLCINGKHVDVKTSVKDLGVVIDCNLTFNEQIKHVVKIMTYHLRNIAFLKKYLDSKTIKMLIHNHVISKLDYCNSLYYGLPNYLLRKLQMVMNRAARLIKGLPPRERITPALIDLHWLPVKARIVYKVCVMTYQAMHSGKPEYIKSLLFDFHSDTTMSLRHDTEPHRLHEPRVNLELGFRAFEKSAPRLYNNLPQHVKNCPNLETFRKALKTHLFTQSYDMTNKSIQYEFRC